MITDFAVNFIKLAYTMEDATKAWDAQHSVKGLMQADPQYVQALADRDRQLRALNKGYDNIKNRSLKEFTQLPYSNGSYNRYKGSLADYDPTDTSPGNSTRNKYIAAKREEKIQQLIREEEAANPYTRSAQLQRQMDSAKGGKQRLAVANVESGLQQQHADAIRNSVMEKVKAMPDSVFEADRRNDLAKWWEGDKAIDKKYDPVLQNFKNKINTVNSNFSDFEKNMQQQYAAQRNAEIKALFEKEQAAAQQRMAQEAAQREAAFAQQQKQVMESVQKGTSNAAKQIGESATQAASKAAPVSRFGRNLGIAGATAALATPALYYLYNRNRNQ